MGFIKEFAEHWIRQMMEDPRERERLWKERMVVAKRRSDKNLEYWSLPVKPYGFWQAPKYTKVYYYKLHQSNIKGRQDPFDVIQPDLINHIERPAFLDPDGYPLD
ncbi:uncharacterized protein LOC9655679 [Selaginella moellendorffii]|nr:uncharacterized protein LOC9655679 [Selaginella moellendorffii]|eukprot:XP_002964089.2 uncharacterized protein LOC9655679 [Selaginella moellendorffii]